MRFKKFDKHDWEMFAGAKEDEKHPALIGIAKDHLIIVDLRGINIYGADLDSYSLFCTYGLAKFIAKNLPEYLDINKLAEMGFQT